MPPDCGIYIITERATGRPYIGQSRALKVRRGQHSRKHFPAESFGFEVLLNCAPDVLDFFERAFIVGYDSIAGGLNKTEGGYAYSKLITEEQRAKRSQQQKEGRGYIPSMQGRTHSEETKAKMRSARLANPMTSEAREKMRKTKTGQALPPFTAEHRARLSSAAKERYARKRATEVTNGTN